MLTACDTHAPPESEPHAVEVEPRELSLIPGDTVHLRYVVRNRRGDVLADHAGPARWHVSDPGVASLGLTGDQVSATNVLVAHGAGMVSISVDAYGRVGRAYAAIGEIRFDNVREKAIEEFRIWGFNLTHPPIVLDTTTNDTNILTAPTRFVSVVYGNNNRKPFLVYLWPDGRTQTLAPSTDMLRPQGEYQVAVVVIEHPYTDFVELLDTSWKAAMDSVNAEHRHWARAAGLPAPLLIFQTTVLRAKPGEFNPEIPDALTDYLERQGIHYDIRAVINLDPGAHRGGWYFHTEDGPWVYVGCRWIACQSGSVLKLTPGAVHDIARTLYHHEIGHALGWLHQWGGGPPGTRIITNPALFGWTDTDGDGVIEILSPKPYGAPGPLVWRRP